MQDLITNWGSLMAVTGGDLNVVKSWWYLVDYTWRKGTWIAINAESDLNLIATSTEGTPVSLRRLYASDASEMLGVLIASEGSTTALVQHLKSEAFRQVIHRNSKFDRLYIVILQPNYDILYLLAFSQKINVSPFYIQQ